MVISVMNRRTSIADRAQWEERLKRGLPRIEALLKKAPGFISFDYLWGLSNDGSMAEVTRWRSRDEYEAYLRSGDAGTAATFLDASLPTAAYPNGNWVRHTYELVG